MEEKVKQRLIGVLVIVGALFIILPFLFHNSRPMVSQKSSTDMPNQAGTPAVSVSLPAATTAALNGSTTATQTQSTTTAAATPATVSSADASSTPAQNSQSVQNTQANPVVTQQAGTTVSTATASNASPANNAAVSVSASDNATVGTSSNPVVNTAANNAPSATTPTTSPSVTTAANNNNVPAASNNAAVAPSSSTAAAPSKASASNNSNALPATTFSGAPSTATALTTGQPNEGPVQNGTAASVVNAPAKVAKVAATEKPMNDMHFTSVSSSSAKPVAHHHAMKKPAVVHGAAWTVQLGVFSDKANATHLVTKLRQHHFEAYSRTIKHGDRTMVAVFVGPEINLQKSESVKNHLNSTFRLNGVVKKYEA